MNDIYDVFPADAKIDCDLGVIRLSSGINSKQLIQYQYLSMCTLHDYRMASV